MQRKATFREEEERTTPNTTHRKSKKVRVTLLISLDVWSNVVLFCNTPEWIQLSYTCKDINQYKFSKNLMKNKTKTMIEDLSPDDITKYFDMSKGTLFNVNLRRNCRNIRDSHLSFLEGIHVLNIRQCVFLTSDAFKYLKGIHTLNMMLWRQETITDKAFTHLKGIHTLIMSECNQDTITDKAFANLKGIHTLNMDECTQETITDAVFDHLQGIESLSFCIRNRESGNGEWDLTVAEWTDADYTSYIESFNLD